MKKLFTRHPETVGETYWTHFKFASITSMTMIMAGIICLLHAIFPFLFEKTASNMMKNLTQKMHTRASE